MDCPSPYSAPGLQRACRVALIADMPDWAFHKIARQITPHLRPQYDCHIFFHQDYDKEHRRNAPKDWRQLFEELRAGHFDLVHFFWRDAVLKFLRALASDPDIRTAAGVEEFLAVVPLTSSVYDHGGLDVESLLSRRQLFDTVVSGYVVSSVALDREYRALSVLPVPDAVVEDGVDVHLFQGRNPGRLARPGRDLVVGWAGDSTWTDGTQGLDHKGLHTIIKPAIAQLQAEGFPARGHFQDRNERWLPYEKMPDYYNTLDVYVCASLHEGTPNPVLEAMACGVPVISTRVGVLPNVFGPLQSEFFLDSRSPEALAGKLAVLADDPALRVRLAEENLRQTRDWTWQRTAGKWRSFFDKVFAEVRTRTGRRNTYSAEVRRRFWKSLATGADRGYFELLAEYKGLKAKWDEIRTSRGVRLIEMLSNSQRRVLKAFGRRSA
jgi:hypothetical protein